MGLSHKQLRE